MKRIATVLAALLRCAACCAAALGFNLAAGARAEASTCYFATSQAAHALCFLDFTGYPGTLNTPYDFTYTFPDGSTLTGTIDNTGYTLGPVGLPVPNQYNPDTFSALGNSAYLGVLGKPAFYGPDTGEGAGPYTLSNLKLTNALGTVLPNVTIAGLDAEDTGQGDGGRAPGNDPNGKITMTWQTTGSDLVALQVMPATGAPAGLCILDNATTNAAFANNTTQSAYCDPTNQTPAGAYILTSALTPSQTFTMSSTSLYGQEGEAFAIQLGLLTVAKSVTSRENSTDQFQVQLINAKGTTFASASTSGTGTTASVTSGIVPTNTYMLKEVATSGNLANYVSTYTCVNAVTSGTTLPSNAVGTSFTLTPALDDQISCTFTNVALTLTDTAGTAQAIAPGNSVTDTFTLKNTSSDAATFVVAQPTVVAANGTSLTPSGYLFKGTTYTTLSALNGAIAAAGATAAGGTIAVGVVYTAPVADGATVVTTLPATSTSGTSASPQATASETDTMPYAALTIVKSGPASSTAGGPIDYSILVTNTGPNAANGATFSDPFPAGLSVAGTPACVAGTGATCGTVTVSGATPPVISSTIATLPSGASVTFKISASGAGGATYTNTATATPPAGTGGGPQMSSVSTTVGSASGLAKTVRDLNNSGETANAADTGKPGDTLQYVLTFTNGTGGTLAGLSFSDPLPAQATYVTAACPAAATTFPSTITACTVSTSTTAGITTVTFTFTGTLVNGASVAASINATIK